jgi:hypothetical protein
MAPVDHPNGRTRRAGRHDQPVARTKKQNAPLTWKLLGTGMAAGTGIAVRKLSDAAWYAARGTHPPKNPAAPGVGWGEALAWAAVSGVAVAAGRLAAARGAASVYQQFTGKLPPGVNAESP